MRGRDAVRILAITAVALQAVDLRYVADAAVASQACAMHSLRHGLGTAIRRLRSGAGFSQEGFADVVGIHRTYMSRVERGLVNISLEYIERIARALGLRAGELLLEAERGGEGTDFDGGK